MKRTYESALKLLETRRRISRPKDVPGTAESFGVSELPNSNGPPPFRGTPSLVGMKEWLQILGHSQRDLDSLRLIHVAGTKGKGSTCAFIRSFLQAHGTRTGFPRKVGLYTSPDLRGIRERIQINDQPIQKDQFTNYFFEVWESLSSHQAVIAGVQGRMPRYLQLLALVAFHTFIQEGTDATIFETHHGGEYDATNVIQQPVVTGITTIGMDHVEQLGPTIENVAWHKAGIFKSGAAACASQQESFVIDVLNSRAAEKGLELQVVDVNKSLPQDLKALGAPVQKQNCSLALAITDAFLRNVQVDQNASLTLDDVVQGVRGFSWPGRFEILSDGNNTWFLDGAHNELSIKQAAEWFSQNADQIRVPRVLIFSHISSQRDGISLLKCLIEGLGKSRMMPNHVIFTTYQENADGSIRLEKQLSSLPTSYHDLPRMYSEVWRNVDSNASVTEKPSIEEAVNLARELGEQNGGMQTFITGSLHLVGGALNRLRPLE